MKKLILNQTKKN